MDTKKPVVSVIIPTFNSQQFVKRCLDSIINQSLKEIEILVIDDMSTDSTVEILNEYAEKFNFINVYKTGKKLMAGGARNVGIDNAKGKYISFVDNDDWVDTNYYHYMVQAIDKENVDIAVSGVKREWSNSKNSAYRYKYNEQNIIDGNYALILLSRVIDQDISISAIVTNKLYKSSFINEYGFRFLENNFNEDDVFTFNAFLNCNRVCITDKTHYHLFQRKNSASRGFSKKHIDDMFFSFKEIREILIKRDQFDEYKGCYYSFFEKCLVYLIESINLSENDDEVINDYYKYAHSINNGAVKFDEFIEYCGNIRLQNFFN